MERKRIQRNENGMPTEAQDYCYEGDEATLHDRPLAYAYVPIQRWRMLYSTDDALGHGTLFEELFKPMEVYGNE